VVPGRRYRTGIDMVEVEWVLLTLNLASDGGPLPPGGHPRFHGRDSGRGVSEIFDKSPADYHARAGIRLTHGGEQPPPVS
jgi:hypothetical protein